MPELPKKDCYIIDNSNDSARTLIAKLCEQTKPGAVIFVTNEEFEVLRDGVIRLEPSLKRR